MRNLFFKGKDCYNQASTAAAATASLVKGMGPGTDLVTLPTACFLAGVGQSWWFDFDLKSCCSGSWDFVRHGQKGPVWATVAVGEFAGN